MKRQNLPPQELLQRATTAVQNHAAVQRQLVVETLERVAQLPKKSERKSIVDPENLNPFLTHAATAWALEQRAQELKSVVLLNEVTQQEVVVTPEDVELLFNDLAESMKMPIPDHARKRVRRLAEDTVQSHPEMKGLQITKKKIGS